MSLVTTLAATHIASDAFHSTQLWKIKTSDAKMMKQIKFHVKLLTIYTCVNTFIAIIGGFAHTFPSKNAGEICYVYKIIEIYIPSWKRELCGLYKATYIIMALILPAACNQVIYISSHLRFQIYLLLVSIRTRFENKSNLKLLDDVNFQKKAFTDMVWIIKRFREIYK